MSDLQRLQHDPDADPELSRLLRAGTPPSAMDAAAFARSRARVRALAAAPFGFAGLVWVKHAALGAALGVTVAVAAATPRLIEQLRGVVPAPSATPVQPAREKPESAHRSAPSKSVSVPSAETPPSGPPTAASAAPRASPAPPLVPAASAESSPNALAALRRESALLEAARSVLDAQPASALRLLAQHEREFPHGTLALEREFLTVSALVRMGERGRAESRAARLRDRAPGNLYERRLEGLLGPTLRPPEATDEPQAH
jgi:hypothetical protein